MRWVVWLLVAFALAVGLALLMHFNQGNVAILWPPYRIDVSVNLMLAALASGFTLFHLLLVGARRALGLPQRVREYRVRRQHELALGALRDTVLAFFEGRLGRAERFARGAQGVAATAGPAALIAARAAHRMQERERRDQWIKDASADAGAAQAVLMTLAEVAVDDRRTPEALDLIEQLNARGSRHVLSLRTALRAYEQAGRWEEVLHTLRLVEKRDALHPAATLKLRVRAVEALIARRGDDVSAVRAIWKSLRSEERAVPEIAARVAASLSAAGAHDEARKIVEQVLDNGFSDEAVLLYARLSNVPMRDRLDRLEAWRKRYGDEEAVLRALGLVCSSERLWGKAEEYLQLAVRRAPSVQARLALGELYESLERSSEAAVQYREAARLAASAA